MAARRGIFTTLFLTAVGVPFLGVGLTAIAAGVRTLRFAPFAFGVLFAGAGVCQIVLALRSRRSRESHALPLPVVGLASGTTPTTRDYRTAAPRTASAREMYAPVLHTAPLPRIRALPGRHLPFALARRDPKQSFALLGFSIVWLAFTAPFWVGMIAAKVWSAAAFLTLFVGVGILILVTSLKKLISLTKLPALEVSDEPVFLGDALRVFVEQKGPASLLRMRIDLICRERAIYSVGTTTRTEEKDVWSHSLLDSEGERIARGKTWSHEVSVDVPKGLPCSFASTYNSVAWLLRVQGTLAGFPDYDELFELRVVPKPPS